METELSEIDEFKLRLRDVADRICDDNDSDMVLLAVNVIEEFEAEVPFYCSSILHRAEERLRR